MMNNHHIDLIHSIYSRTNTSPPVNLSDCLLMPSLKLSSKRALCDIYESSNRALKRCRITPTTTSTTAAGAAVATTAVPPSPPPSSPPSMPRKVCPSKVGITTYSPNDVLSGRGGGTNQHEGNCYFRALINENREKYLRAKKNDKPFISLSVVSAIRRRNGRFLKKDDKSNLWFEIGDAAAREKTSQALRQRAPEFRKHLLAKDTQKSLQQQLQQRVSPSLTKQGAASGALMNLNTISPPLNFANNNVAHPVSPCSNDNHNNSSSSRNGLIFHALRQAQLNEARETLRLQQKLQTIKAFELMLKSSSSNCFQV